jgi:rfaE bifunctional protein nucleotidyltransferase chain/domain
MVKKIIKKIKDSAVQRRIAKKGITHVKIKTRKEIEKIISNLKKQGKVVVTTNGDFDLLHTGHITSLEIAKTKGDILVVALNSDKSSLKKHPMTQKEKARMIAALDAVDYVVLFDENNPQAILDAIKPHVHVNSKNKLHSIEKGLVEKHGGKLILIDHPDKHSTTNILKKIMNFSKK